MWQWLKHRPALHSDTSVYRWPYMQQQSHIYNGAKTLQPPGESTAIGMWVRCTDHLFMTMLADANRLCGQSYKIQHIYYVLIMLFENDYVSGLCLLWSLSVTDSVFLLVTYVDHKTVCSVLLALPSVSLANCTHQLHQGPGWVTDLRLQYLYK